MRIKDSELKAVLESVEQELSAMYELNKSELLKAAPPGLEDDGSAEAPPAPEGTPEGGESAPAEGSAPGPDASAPAPDAVPPEASDSSDAPADPAAVAPEADQQLSPEALQAEYAQLSPEELDMHLQAAMAAKEAMSGGAGAPPDMGAPPAAPAPEAAPAMKGELKINKEANGGVIKSEEVTKLEALVKSQAEDIQNLTKAVQMVVERPIRKAVTGISYLAKSEETKQEEKTFSPAEAREKLRELIPTLNKSERDLVLGFFEGRTPAAKLEKILDKAK